MKMRIYLISVDGRKRIKMKMMTKNIAGACVGSMGKELTSQHAILLFSNVLVCMDIGKRVKRVVLT